MNNTAEQAGQALVDPGFFQRLTAYIGDALQSLWENLPAILVNIALCIGIWFLAKFIIRLISKRTGVYFKNEYRSGKYTQEQINRKRSVATLVRSIARYGIYAIAILAILSIIGLGDATAVIAGAGIGSIAIGFGAQNLVKDVISGLFMLFENQYSVGDYVEIDSSAEKVKGTVEAIAMRVTYVRNELGQQIVIPNGSILQVVNCSRGGWLAVVDVPVAYEESIAEVSAVILAVAKEAAAERPELVSGEPAISGVTEFGDSAITIRVICRAVATKQKIFERLLRQRIKERFDELGIEIPYSKVVVHSPGCAQPAGKHEKIQEYLKKEHIDKVELSTEIDEVNEEDAD